MKLALVAIAAICLIPCVVAQDFNVSEAVHTNITVQPAFSVDEARRFWYYSCAAYCPTAVLQTWKCKFCKGNVTLIDTVYDQKTNTFGYVAYDGQRNEIVLTYRGTQPTSIKNWIENLKFWKADTPFDGLANAKVAKGFGEVQKALASGSTAAVKRAFAMYPSARLVVTGHSLGGAIATLAALDIQVTQGIKGDLFTYGSPRVGNIGFFNQYAARMSGRQQWRLVNDRDIVPHLPPHAFDFEHLDQEVWEHKADYKSCNTGGEDPKCSASVILPILPDSIWDHLHYMEIEGGLCFGLNNEIIPSDF